MFLLNFDNEFIDSSFSEGSITTVSKSFGFMSMIFPLIFLLVFVFVFISIFMALRRSSSIIKYTKDVINSAKQDMDGNDNFEKFEIIYEDENSVNSDKNTSLDEETINDIKDDLREEIKQDLRKEFERNAKKITCYHCETRYSETLDECPNCGSVKIDKD